jgi:hypothetical protein
LRYGVSITDACIDWETTSALMHELRAALKDVLVERQRGVPAREKLGAARGS